MGEAAIAQLKGFDSFQVSLGDEMRGERASKGKSLLDVQRELRIKAAHIDAIENAAPDAIPHRGFVSGYVRAYARYLGMDEDAVLRRFCEEARFEPSSGPIAPRESRGPATARRRDDLDAVIAGSRLAAASRAAAISADLGSTVRAACSLGVLAGLLGGLGYGGWALLENIQRVEFAPVSTAPDALATAPDIESITRIARAGAVPAPVIDAAALAAVYALQEVSPPRLEARDGPISALDPERTGVYASRDPAGRAGGDAVDPPLAAALGSVAAVADATVAAATPAAPASAAPAPVATGVALVFDGEAWVRVRDATGVVVHEALMRPGQSWRAPQGAEGYTLRAGNAGGVFIEIDGARFGPLGRAGAVVSNVLLDPQAVRRVFPNAAAAAASRPVAAAVPPSSLHSAAAGLPRP